MERGKKILTGVVCYVWKNLLRYGSEEYEKSMDLCPVLWAYGIGFWMLCNNTNCADCSHYSAGI